jgi:LytR cell envelope-related transcriptional attenuator
MVLFALSFQGQVEKYGVYVGIAAFFGLAVLSLLYFSQARELKRLREWAGRAPERAQELEQRVVAEAAANVARRGPGAAAAIAPPRRLAEMPAPPRPQTAAGAQATEVAEAVETGEPVTNGNVPAAPGAATPGGANGAVPPAEAADREHGDGVPPKPDADEEPEDKAAEPAEAKDEQAEQPETGEQPAPPEPEPQPAGEQPAQPQAAGEQSAPPQPAPEPDREEQPASQPDEAEAEPEPAVAARPGEVPAAVPRATPAQRVGVTPRPAPMPLRQSRPSATPAAGRGGKRPGAPPPRRAAKAPREGRSAGTIALLVGIAVLILGGGTFVISQLGGDEAPTPPNRSAPPPTQPDTGTGGGGTQEPAKTAAETNVAVLNGTTFTGLAGQLADRVSQEGGYERGATETNTRDQTIQTSTVFYADGFRGQARKVAELLSISAVEPVDAETQALAPEADVVVLAGADQAP